MEKARFAMRWYWLALLAIFVFAWFPLASGIIASSIADANGCNLHEGFVNPCVIGGTDWGETLYAMGVTTWLMLVTFPLGGLFFLIWLAVLVIHRLSWRKAQV